MNEAQAKTTAFAKLAKLPIAQVQEIANQLMDKYDEDSSLAYKWTMDYLMSVMPEDEFIAFCDSEF